MRVCLICEGCYPYIPGGVSSWVQMLCTHFSNIEFVIWSIATTKKEMSKISYKMPENVKELRTMYIGEETFKQSHKQIRLMKKEQQTLRAFVLNEDKNIQWQELLEFFKKYRNRLEDILMSEDFYNICLEKYISTDSKKVFTDFLWNYRSMYFPLMFILSEEIPEADIYHSVSTGYAGILGSCASYVRNKPFLLSEHGIYTREREEDIIRSQWVEGDYKQNWIDFFFMLSHVAYEKADIVTSLFEMNRMLQIEVGCPQDKIQIIPNGVQTKELSELKVMNKLPKEKFNIGAVIRVVPIKDVKTMILSFAMVRDKYEDTVLYIMGNCGEDEEYYEECKLIIEEIGIPDIVFLGQVNIKEYLPEMDLLLLSSISEGQPLAVIEGMAAGIPFVATNVGDCKGLLEGDGEDDFGRAGMIVPVMNSEAMAHAIEYLYKHPEERKNMGKAGQQRACARYAKESYLEEYRKLYERFGGK